jgi:hypothetical protein
VQRAAATENGWQLETSSGPMRAWAIIVATSTHQTPRFPSAAKRLDKSILLISAAEFREATAAATSFAGTTRWD